jgi:hypothetical protein
MTTLTLLPKEITITEDEIIKKAKWALQHLLECQEKDSYLFADNEKDMASHNEIIQWHKDDIAIINRCRVPAVDYLYANDDLEFRFAYRNEAGRFEYTNISMSISFLVELVIKDKLGLDVPDDKFDAQLAAEICYLYHYDCVDPMENWFDRASITATEDLQWEIPLMTEAYAELTQDFYTLEEFRSANVDNKLLFEEAKSRAAMDLRLESKFGGPKGKPLNIDKWRLPSYAECLIPDYRDRHRICAEVKAAYKQLQTIV